MDSPLYNKIKELTEGKIYPLHMPGHKRTGLFMDNNLLGLDVTEIEGSDNMHHPTEAILEAEKRLAELNKCDRSLFLINGGSSGVLTALVGTLNEGDKVIVCRNAHKSVHNGLIISGAMPYYVYPQVEEGYLSTVITPQALENAFKEVQAKAVLITSPTYEGFTCKTDELAEICHKNNAILIVDETHGAHFAFSDRFPKTAMEQGADISVNSWHKTLPCPNQGAVININTERVDMDRLFSAYSMVQSTSPSYIIMCSIDRARAELTENPKYFEEYTGLLIELRDRLKKLKGLRLVDLSYSKEANDYDISKLVLFTGENLSGKALAQRLLKEYNIQVELEGLHHIIAMTSVADSKEGLLRFVKALEETDKELKPYVPVKGNYSSYNNSSPVMSPRQVYYSKGEYVDTADALGRVAAQDITPFPPDIPLVALGEVITKESLELIAAYKDHGIELLGIDNNKIKVIKEN